MSSHTCPNHGKSLPDLPSSGPNQGPGILAQRQRLAQLLGNLLAEHWLRAANHVQSGPHGTKAKIKRD
jgi:hypothetical protein